MESRKAAIMLALDKFVRQRPGLEFGNYGDVKAYRSEMRSITKDRHHYDWLAARTASYDGITADDLIRAAKSAYGGRLTIEFKPAGKHVKGVFIPSPVPDAPEVCAIDYVTGQYFPTEYRKAACAVLASALWDHVRENCMPPATMHHNSETGEDVQRYKGLRAGDWLRAHFRKEFGASIANRWFA